MQSHRLLPGHPNPVLCSRGSREARETWEKTPVIGFATFFEVLLWAQEIVIGWAEPRAGPHPGDALTARHDRRVLLDGVGGGNREIEEYLYSCCGRKYARSQGYGSSSGWWSLSGSVQLSQLSTRWQHSYGCRAAPHSSASAVALPRTARSPANEQRFFHNPKRIPLFFFYIHHHPPHPHCPALLLKSLVKSYI